MQERPSHRELTYFASLVVAKTIEPNLAPELSADQFIEQLDYHGIALLALQGGLLPKNVANKLKGRKAMMAASEVLKQKALVELFDAFDEAGLTANILFKGSALAHTVYPQPWLRPRSDNDCLIAHADYEKFVSVLEQLGFQKQFAMEGRYVSYQNSFSKKLAGQASLNIDLHWRINNRQLLAGLFDVRELLASGQTLSELSKSIKIPCVVDSLLIASLHRLGHHQSEERLAWLYDVHLLASSLTTEQWQQLCLKSEDKRLAAVTLDALTFCRDLFATLIPQHANDRLSALASRAEPSQLFLNRDLVEWKIFLYDLKGLTGWKSKLSLIRENFFPNPDYIREQMKTDNLVLAYVRRILNGIYRVTR